MCQTKIKLEKLRKENDALKIQLDYEKMRADRLQEDLDNIDDFYAMYQQTLNKRLN